MNSDVSALIRRLESLRLTAYRCPAGIWTIGYGHTQGVVPGMTITADRAEELLRQDLAPIDAAIPRTLAPNRRQALASFIFNVGMGAWQRSSLRRLIADNPDNPSIRGQFMRWVYAGKRKLPGLENRRRIEADLYFSLQ